MRQRLSLAAGRPAAAGAGAGRRARPWSIRCRRVQCGGSGGSARAPRPAARSRHPAGAARGRVRTPPARPPGPPFDGSEDPAQQAGLGRRDPPGDQPGNERVATARVGQHRGRNRAGAPRPGPTGWQRPEQGGRQPGAPGDHNRVAAAHRERAGPGPAAATARTDRPSRPAARAAASGGPARATAGPARAPGRWRRRGRGRAAPARRPRAPARAPRGCAPASSAATPAGDRWRQVLPDHVELHVGEHVPAVVPHATSLTPESAPTVGRAAGERRRFRSNPGVRSRTPARGGPDTAMAGARDAHRPSWFSRIWPAVSSGLDNRPAGRATSSRAAAAGGARSGCRRTASAR